MEDVARTPDTRHFTPAQQARFEALLKLNEVRAITGVEYAEMYNRSADFRKMHARLWRQMTRRPTRTIYARLAPLAACILKGPRPRTARRAARRRAATAPPGGGDDPPADPASIPFVPPESIPTISPEDAVALIALGRALPFVVDDLLAGRRWFIASRRTVRS